MTERKPLEHARLKTLDVDDGELAIGGKKLSDVVAQVGMTPFYAYDRNAMSTRVASLRKILPQDIHLHYAIKANPMPAVVAHMAGLVDGLDVASARELVVATQTPMPADQISFAGPGKTDHDLSTAINAGVVINAESENEIRRIATLGEQHGVRPLVAVRVNPDFELKTSGMKMAGGPKVFGIDSERVPDVLGLIGAMDLDFRGFHIFCGSQNLRPDAICEAQQKTVELAIELSQHASVPIQQLNIGGGLGIPYFPGEQPLDTAPIADNLATLVPKIRAAMPKVEIIMELGRYFVGEAGYYVCRIVDRKISRGHVYLVTDGGLHHHLAASGNFGQVIRKNYPVVIGNLMDSAETEVVTVTGPLCTPLDLLADRMNLARADVGDLVVVLQSGAYGLTASPLGFLSHPEPGEILI